jgi:hypothetical protein
MKVTIRLSRHVPWALAWGVARARHMSSPAGTMRAVVVKSPGSPENLSIGEIARPSAREAHLLVRVAYTALNRADTLQR